MSTIILKAHKICLQLKNCDFLLIFLALLRYFQNSAINLIFDQKRFSTSQFLDFFMNFFLRFFLFSPIGYYKSCIRKFKWFFSLYRVKTLFFDFFEKRRMIANSTYQHKKNPGSFFSHIPTYFCYIYFLNSFTYFLNKK